MLPERGLRLRKQRRCDDVEGVVDDYIRKASPTLKALGLNTQDLIESFGSRPIWIAPWPASISFRRTTGEFLLAMYLEMKHANLQHPAMIAVED